MTKQTITVPDIGTDEAAEVVEIYVAVGDTVDVEQSLIVLETDKASVEVPSSAAGKVLKVLVQEGDQIKTGTPIVELQEEDASDSADSTSEQPAESVKEGAKEKEIAPEKVTAQAEQEKAPVSETVKVPDLGGAKDVDVIELCVSVGDDISEGDSLIVLETDKASMEVPATVSGKITSLDINVGDKINEGQVIATIVGAGSASSAEGATEKNAPEKTASAPAKPAATSTTSSSIATSPNTAQAVKSLPTDKAGSVYAGPSVRKLARQLGVDLTKVKGSGPRARILKDDVRQFVRDIIAGKGGGSAIPEVPKIDFSQFGKIERVKLTKIQRATAANMHRSWLNVPHVTQFDDANISNLEDYRKSLKAEAEKRGVKITPVAFLIKAAAMSLRAEPSFNVSLDDDHRIIKDYVHIGMAVDAPVGLVVPVLRDVDKKDIWQIAEEIGVMAGKARDGKLTPKDMQGGCFTISSLGAIGGQGFTPIVNTPEVGILGVSKASTKPFWNGKEFEPKTFLPLSLSYDHKAVNGADAGRFLTHLVKLLENHEEMIK